MIILGDDSLSGSRVCTLNYDIVNRNLHDRLIAYFLGSCMSQRTPIRYVAPMSQFQPDRETRFIPIHSLNFFVFLERTSDVDGFGY